MTSVTTEVRTSKTDELRSVNQPLARHDQKEKIEASTKYAGDLSYAGMLHARLVRSNLPAARITRRDVTEARKVPGVVAVLLGEDVPNNETRVDVPGQRVVVGALIATMQVLAVDRVRFHGEPVALVIAETEDAMARACQLVEIDYEPLQVVTDPFQALEPDSALVHDSGNLLASWDVDVGDVDGAFASADVIIENDYQTQFVDHAYLEPEVGVGWLDDDGVITLRVSTQVVEHYRDVARILGVDESKVRVIAPYVGGGFGGKEDMTVEPYLGLAVALTKRPVRMQWTRSESLLARPKRHRSFMHYRTAASSDGTLLAQDILITSDAGAYAYLSALVLLYSTVHACGPYRVPNVRIRSKTVYTNNAPTSAFRGFGGMQVVLGYESQIDELARRLHLDGGDVRKRNALRKGDTLPVGQEILTEVQLAQTIDAVREVAGDRPEPSGPRKVVGRAIASNMQSYGRLVYLNDSAAAWIGFQMDGSVSVRCGVQDIGGGQASSLAQITSEILGVDIDRISVHFGDSTLNPVAGTTTATRQLYMSGNATYETAIALRDQILVCVAAEIGAPVESLSMVDGTVKGVDQTLTLQDALQFCRRRDVPIEALHTFFGPKGKQLSHSLQSNRFFPEFTFGTHLADIEIDLDTGQIEVLKYVVAHDVGRAINPLSVEGQMAGAVVQGLGQALLEDVVMDEGINQVPGLFKYMIPTSTDLPDIQTVIIESGEGLGPFGARGIGESPIGPPIGVIPAAVADALGIRPTVLPVTPERVLACVDGSAASRADASDGKG